MVDAEKIKKGLDICGLRSAGDCTYCPYFENTYCNDLLASDAAEYIASLEERIAIKDEALEALEKRCNALEALEKREQVRWINMDEDEPLLGQKVLVYRAQKPVEIMSMLFVDNEYWWRNYADEIFKVYDNDYWMPLPEPPKEVSE